MTSQIYPTAWQNRGIVADDETWWSLSKAARAVGRTPETIRLWATRDRVSSQRVPHGQRERIFVLAPEVLREAGQAPSTGEEGAVAALGTSELRDRVATLEEVVRRYRMIDELRDEISERERAVAAHHRDIEVFLQGPATVPQS